MYYQCGGFKFRFELWYVKLHLYIDQTSLDLSRFVHLSSVLHFSFLSAGRSAKVNITVATSNPKWQVEQACWTQSVRVFFSHNPILIQFPHLYHYYILLLEIQLLQQRSLILKLNSYIPSKLPFGSSIKYLLVVWLADFSLIILW